MTAPLKWGWSLATAYEWLVTLVGVPFCSYPRSLSRKSQPEPPINSIATSWSDSAALLRSDVGLGSQGSSSSQYMWMAGNWINGIVWNYATTGRLWRKSHINWSLDRVIHAVVLQLYKINMEDLSRMSFYKNIRLKMEYEHDRRFKNRVSSKPVCCFIGIILDWLPTIGVFRTKNINSYGVRSVIV